MRAEIAYEREQKKIAKSTQGWKGARMTVDFAVYKKAECQPTEKSFSARIQKSGNSLKIVKSTKRPNSHVKSVLSRQNLGTQVCENDIQQSSQVSAKIPRSFPSISKERALAMAKKLLLRDSPLLDYSSQQLNALKKSIRDPSFLETMKSEIKVQEVLDDSVGTLGASDVKNTIHPAFMGGTPNSSLATFSRQTPEVYAVAAKQPAQLQFGNTALTAAPVKQAESTQGAIASLPTASTQQVVQSQSAVAPFHVGTDKQASQSQSVMVPLQAFPVSNSSPSTAGSISQHNVFQMGLTGSGQNMASPIMNFMSTNLYNTGNGYPSHINTTGVNTNFVENSNSTLQTMAVLGNNPAVGYSNQAINPMVNNTVYAVMNSASMNINTMTNTNGGCSQLTGTAVNNVFANTGIVNNGLVNNGFFHAGFDNTGLANNNLLNNTIVSDGFGNDYILCQNGTFLRV